MLTRRHIRVKVMQCIYALVQSKDDSLQKQEKFLRVSIENMYVLYLLILSLLAELHRLAEKHVSHASKKYVATEEDKYPNPEKFVKNRLLLQLVNNEALKNELSKRKLDNWYLNDEYVKIIYKEIMASEIYKQYMLNGADDYTDDRDVVLQLFKEIIAPNEKIYDYFEDDKLTWVDDFPIVNTFLVKRLKKAKPDSGDRFFLPALLKDQQDMDFANDLLTKTLLNDGKWEKEIEGKTPNWDNDRIAEIDSIILKMAICELLNFPSIPEKVTLNEYLEIAKEYSTPKSSIFINGVLDKLAKEYKSDGRLQKIGRGLQ
ncbi:MAG TPA: transcription antitermination factor NusB [Muricauda sp.]|uniref:Transcription antitermination factor NusB n=1 Tax=Flagellimonas aurea TaxID=2915619 RepID=A0ABS3G2S6_9FLAO|nr:transcription antitermination factor NusB [Allomuricauda aurea]MAO18097.1 transcription antitermination factor NusB [Allomuricauda sp.]MBO0353719.1 transcription antitermination factor NusB [Allomuricauda aurea]HBU79813.1 transcription antitermination factor NusB [Allomuricauda sp.]